MKEYPNFISVKDADKVVKETKDMLNYFENLIYQTLRIPSNRLRFEKRFFGYRWYNFKRPIMF